MMKFSLTDKGKSIARTTLQGLGLTDEEITKLMDGEKIESDPVSLDALIEHEMVTDVSYKAPKKKVEEVDGIDDIQSEG